MGTNKNYFYLLGVILCNVQQNNRLHFSQLLIFLMLTLRGTFRMTGSIIKFSIDLLTHCGLVTPKNWVNVGSGNGFLPGGKKIIA